MSAAACRTAQSPSPITRLHRVVCRTAVSSSWTVLATRPLIQRKVWWEWFSGVLLRSVQLKRSFTLSFLYKLLRLPDPHMNVSFLLLPVVVCFISTVIQCLSLISSSSFRWWFRSNLVLVVTSTTTLTHPFIYQLTYRFIPYTSPPSKQRSYPTRTLATAKC